MILAYNLIILVVYFCVNLLPPKVGKSMKRSVITFLFVAMVAFAGAGVAKAEIVNLVESRFSSPDSVAYAGWGPFESAISSTTGLTVMRGADTGDLYNFIKLDWRAGSFQQNQNEMIAYSDTGYFQFDRIITDQKRNALQNMVGMYVDLENTGVLAGNVSLYSAALQMAVYEVLTDITWNIATGDFTVQGWGSYSYQSGYVQNDTMTALLLSQTTGFLAAATDDRFNLFAAPIELVNLVDSYQNIMPYLKFMAAANGGDSDPQPNPTPEPGTVLLMGLGLAGLAAVRRFRK